MSDVIAPLKKVKFTITKTPTRVADRKTLERLMLMQRNIQKGLQRLSKRRKRHDNYTSPRAGRMWMTRMPTTKIIRAEKGASFTLFVTPQLLNDIKSVQKYLDVKSAK